MKTLERIEGARQQGMAYYVRPMRAGDIPQVAEIERECFPTGWSPTPFRRELQNRMASYLTACRALDPARAWDEAQGGPQPDAAARSRSAPFLPRLAHSLRVLFASGPQEAAETTTVQHIAGYVGLWFVADEAHITAIGVRGPERRHGIGELLLLASLEMGIRRGSRVETLETRVSNYPAQALYLKYGFERAGIRKRYYTDNGEDALIMTTAPLTSAGYQQRLERLRQEHRSRWGESVRYLG